MIYTNMIIKIYYNFNTIKEEIGNIIFVIRPM